MREPCGGHHSSGPALLPAEFWRPRRSATWRRSRACPWRCTARDTPVGALASVHCAAATENFLVLENHAVDVPWWSDLVDGIEKPIVNKGFITVPDKPGLGITLNEAALQAAPGRARMVRAHRPVEQHRPHQRSPLELTQSWVGQALPPASH